MSDEPCEASMTGHPSPVWRNVLPTQMYPSGIKFRFDVFMPASDDLKHSCVDSHKIELQDFVDLWGTRNRRAVAQRLHLNSEYVAASPATIE